MKNKVLFFSLTIIALVVFSFAAIAQEPIKIGFISPKSGNYADHGEMERIGMYLAIEDFGGEVLGRPIEVIEIDSETTPDIASRRVKTLIEAQDVKFFLGAVSSSAAIAVGSVCHEMGSIYICTNANSDTITGVDGNKHTFRVPPNMAILVRGAAEYVAENLGKNWYFITHDYSWGWSGTEWARNMLDEVGTVKVGEVKIPMDTRDMSSYLLKLMNSGADVA